MASFKVTAFDLVGLSQLDLEVLERILSDYVSRDGTGLDGKELEMFAAARHLYNTFIAMRGV